MKNRNENGVFDPEQMQKSEAFLSAFLENVECIAYILDKNLRYVHLSRVLKAKLKKDFGIDANPGDRISGIIIKNDRAAIREWKKIFSQAFKGKSLKFVKKFTCSGKPEAWSFLITPVWQNGKIISILCFSRNVSEMERVWSVLGSFRGRPAGNGRPMLRCITPSANLTSVQAINLEPVFSLILSEWNEPLTEKAAITIIKIIDLLLQHSDTPPPIAEHKAGTQPNPIIKRFKELIGQHYQKERTVKFYANALHVHPFYLNSIIKNHTGFTAKQTIVNHIIHEAMHLLSSTGLSVKEISFVMGFEHTEHFCALFKNKTNLSPSGYRAQYR